MFWWNLHALTGRLKTKRGNEEMMESLGAWGREENRQMGTLTQHGGSEEEEYRLSESGGRFDEALCII